MVRMDTAGYVCRHVSLANPRGTNQTNLPLLLRRVANLMAEMEIRSEDVMDLTFASEVTADGPWWSATVYWSSGASSEDEADRPPAPSEVD
jgi:hypothetical protein